MEFKLQTQDKHPLVAFSVYDENYLIFQLIVNTSYQFVDCTTDTTSPYLTLLLIGKKEKIYCVWNNAPLRETNSTNNLNYDVALIFPRKSS